MSQRVIQPAPGQHNNGAESPFQSHACMAEHMCLVREVLKAGNVRETGSAVKGLDNTSLNGVLQQLREKTTPCITSLRGGPSKRN